MTDPIYAGLSSLEAAMAAAAERKPLKVRRRPSLYAAPRPEAIAAERDAYAHSRHAVAARMQELDDETGGHRAHRRLRKVETLMATCRECGEARIRSLAKNPSIHIQYVAEQLADRYEVEL